MSFVVFDLETTGFSPAKDEIIEIAARVLGGSGATFQSFAKPLAGKIPARITKLTGITDEHVEAAPPPSDAVRAFLSWVRLRCAPPVTLVGHNAIAFDKRFIEEQLNRAPVPVQMSAAAGAGETGALHLRVFDTLLYARHVGLSTYSGKLKQADIFQTIFGRAPDQQHSATGDVDALCSVIQSDAWQASSNNIFDDACSVPLVLHV